jgi:hypothetical protein
MEGYLTPLKIYLWVVSLYPRFCHDVNRLHMDLYQYKLSSKNLYYLV